MTKKIDVYQERIDALMESKREAEAALQEQPPNTDTAILHLLGGLFVDRIYELTMLRGGYRG